MDKNSLHAQPEMDPMEETESPLQRRPFGVTLLLWLVLCLSAWGSLRLAGALRWWDLLLEKDARLSPLYLSITGAGWALVGLVLLWSIVSIRQWSYIAVPISVLAWLVEYWIERLFFQGVRANTSFMVVASIVILAMTVICAFNRSTKIYLTKSEEHEQSKDRTSP